MTPQKEGIWGRWAGFVTRRPLIPVLLAVALMVPLIIPVLSLELGQEDIGQTNPATMQRRAYDLMAQAYGPGFNGPLIIAVAVAPKAKGDPKVVDQENQLKSLQKTLKQEQKEGNQTAGRDQRPSRRSWSSSRRSWSTSRRCSTSSRHR